MERGKRPAVLTRGYGGRAGRGPLVVGDGDGALCDALSGGDEPVMLAKSVPGASVVAGSDRYSAGIHAVERLGADCAILDDGYQHLRLHRDLDLLLMDSSRPLGTGALLPAGTLREPASAVSRADLVIFTRWNQRDDGAPDRTKVESVAGEANVIHAEHKFAGFAAVNGRGVGTPSVPDAGGGDGAPSGPVLLVSGIASPRSFVATASEAGLHVRGHMRFPDHHEFSARDIDEIGRRAREVEAGAVVTSEKDAVRLEGKAEAVGVPVFSLTVEVEIVKGLSVALEALGRLFGPGAARL